MSDETYTAIENWIWSQHGPSMSGWAKIEVAMPAKSRRLGVYDSRKGYEIGNLQFLCNEVDALCEQEITRPAAVSLLRSFFARWGYRESDPRHKDIFKDIFEDVAEGIKEQQKGGGITATLRDKASLSHLVAFLDKSDFLAILIQRGADMEAGAGGYGTPLHVAAQLGSAQAVLFLLDQGANADALDAKGATPFMRACFFWGGYYSPNSYQPHHRRNVTSQWEPTNSSSFLRPRENGRDREAYNCYCAGCRCV
jgi:hypothetical protein